jgi:hypothetical protein
LDIVRCGSTTSGDRVPFTAFAFTGFAMAVDFFLVALIFIRGLEMFTSLLGTWIPFGLIFASTFVTGSLVASRRVPLASATRA